MNVEHSRRVLVALGTGVALSLIAATASFGAQSAPRLDPADAPPRSAGPAEQRPLPPPPQSREQRERRDDARNDRRDDRRFDRRDDGRLAGRGDMLERRLDFLHERLRIRANQESVWRDFAGAVREETDIARDRVQDRRNDARRGPSTAIERLERRGERLDNQRARVDHLLRELRPLYATLDAGQRQTADLLFFRPGVDNGERFFNRRVPGPDGRDDRRFGRGFDRQD